MLASVLALATMHLIIYMIKARAEGNDLQIYLQEIVTYYYYKSIYKTMMI